MKNAIRNTTLCLTALIVWTLTPSAEACTKPPLEPVISVTTHGTQCFLDGTCLSVAWVTYGNFTTFGSAANTFCACGLSKVGGIQAVLTAELVDTGTGQALTDFDFALSSGVTTSAAQNLVGTDVQGLLASINNAQTGGIPVELRFKVILEDGTSPQQVEAALLGSGGATLITGEADASGTFVGHEALLPHQPDCAAGTTVDQDFESGALGWTNDGASTCTTGAYVLGTPTEQINGGVTTQVGGDHTTGSGNACFTATNSSAGVNDVDGGNCILRSPTWTVTEDSVLSAWYFHGQRDAGDDPSGDFFKFEVSTNGGTTFDSLVSTGDIQVSAEWVHVTATIPAASNVVLRMQASDGSGPGDIVEAGIDDVQICKAQ